MNVVTHQPVMIKEAMKALNIRKDYLYVDATFGLGGYSKKILKTEDCQVIAIDRDPDVEKYTKILKKNYGSKFKFILGTFGNLTKILDTEKVETISGELNIPLGATLGDYDVEIYNYSTNN